MEIIQTIILISLILISLSTIRETIASKKALQRLSFLPQEMKSCSQASRGIGCSIICSSVRSVRHIERLLSIEYDKYEVIVVIDSLRHKHSFERIINHFHLLRVSNPACDELPSSAIRQLYRSRLRAMRRIILVDRRQVSEYDDLNAATAVASFEQLLPIGKNSYIHPQAIEVLISTISHARVKRQQVDLIKSSTLANGYIFSRERVIQLGGFSARILRNIDKERVACVHAPICYREESARGIIIRALIFFLLVVAIMPFGILTCVALLLTLTLQWSFISLLDSPELEKKCSTQARLCYLCLKWDFFSRRIFTIS